MELDIIDLYYRCFTNPHWVHVEAQNYFIVEVKPVPSREMYLLVGAYVAFDFNEMVHCLTEQFMILISFRKL